MKKILLCSLLVQGFLYSEAPREMPLELYDEYTLNGQSVSDFGFYQKSGYLHR